MDYVAEQEMELEALQAILMEDLTGSMPQNPWLQVVMCIFAVMTSGQLCCRVDR